MTLVVVTGVYCHPNAYALVKSTIVVYSKTITYSWYIIVGKTIITGSFHRCSQHHLWVSKRVPKYRASFVVFFVVNSFCGFIYASLRWMEIKSLIDSTSTIVNLVQKIVSPRCRKLNLVTVVFCSRSVFNRRSLPQKCHSRRVYHRCILLQFSEITIEKASH